MMMFLVNREIQGGVQHIQVDIKMTQSLEAASINLKAAVDDR